MSTMVARFALIATTAVLLALPIVSAAPKSQHGKAAAKDEAGIHLFNFPGNISDETCGSKSSTDPNPCEQTTYRVTIVRVSDPRGKVFGCLAVFPYNSLRILTTTNKEETYLHWDIDPNAKAQFFDVGVAISHRGLGPSPSGYFDTPDVSAQSVTVHFFKNKPHGKQFDHQPKVKLTDGDQQECLGVDPTIGNSAN
jgi:hypothetical protein